MRKAFRKLGAFFLANVRYNKSNSIIERKSKLLKKGESMSRRSNHRRTNRRYKRRRKLWVFLALFFLVIFLFLKYAPLAIIDK